MVAVMASIVVAQAKISLAYEAGAEVVSSYLWRGQYNGGLSFQPTASVGFDAQDEKIQFRVGAWASMGASDWKFAKGLAENENGNPNTYFIPELDIMGSIQLWGATFGFTHYYYFGRTPFFSGLEDDGGSQTEIQVGFNFGEVSKANLYFNWYTMIAGNDVRYDDNGDAHRAFSSYIEVGYDFDLPFNITLGIQIGMTPWKSLYTDYEGGFAVNNLQARLGKTWSVGNEVCEIELFALGCLNTYDINKNNVFINAAGDDKLYLQKLNGTIGLGFWF